MEEELPHARARVAAQEPRDVEPEDDEVEAHRCNTKKKPRDRVSATPTRDRIRNTGGGTARTRPVREAQEEVVRRRDDARLLRGVVVRRDDEHAAVEDGPVREAEDAEGDDDRQLVVPERDAVYVAEPTEPSVGRDSGIGSGRAVRLEAAGSARRDHGFNERPAYVLSMRVVEAQMMAMLPAHWFQIVSGGGRGSDDGRAYADERVERLAVDLGRLESQILREWKRARGLTSVLMVKDAIL